MVLKKKKKMVNSERGEIKRKMRSLQWMTTLLTNFSEQKENQILFFHSPCIMYCSYYIMLLFFPLFHLGFALFMGWKYISMFFVMLGFDFGLGYIIYMKRMGSNAMYWCVKLLCPIHWTIWRCCKWHIWGWWPPLLFSQLGNS